MLRDQGRESGVEPSTCRWRFLAKTDFLGGAELSDLKQGGIREGRGEPISPLAPNLKKVFNAVKVKKKKEKKRNRGNVGPSTF